MELFWNIPDHWETRRPASDAESFTVDHHAFSPRVILRIHDLKKERPLRAGLGRAEQGGRSNQIRPNRTHCSHEVCGAIAAEMYSEVYHTL